MALGAVAISILSSLVMYLLLGGRASRPAPSPAIARSDPHSPDPQKADAPPSPSPAEPASSASGPRATWQALWDAARAGRREALLACFSKEAQSRIALLDRMIAERARDLPEHMRGLTVAGLLTSMAQAAKSAPVVSGGRGVGNRATLEIAGDWGSETVAFVHEGDAWKMDRDMPPIERLARDIEVALAARRLADAEVAKLKTQSGGPAKASSASQAEVARLKLQLDEALAARKAAEGAAQLAAQELKLAKDQLEALTTKHADEIAKLREQLDVASKAKGAPEAGSAEAKARPPEASPPPVETPGPSTPPAKAEEAPAKAPEPPRPSAAELAAAATDYLALQPKLRELRAAGRYGAAIAECRLFLGKHSGTPHGRLVKSDQDALRYQVRQLCDESLRRFRQAIEKDKLDAAKQVADDLEPYDAPEIREALGRMRAELKEAGYQAAEAKAQAPGSEAQYLAQWETPPNVARLLPQLRSENDSAARGSAAKELGRIGHRAALGGLLGALRDPDWYVVSSALQAIGDIGDPIALPRVAPLARAVLPAVSDRAAAACRALAQAPRDKFADAWRLVDRRKVADDLAQALLLSGSDGPSFTPRYRIALVETLALLDARESAPAIRPMLMSKDPEVRRTAGAALRTLTGEGVPPEGPPRPPLPPAPPPTKRSLEVQP